MNRKPFAVYISVFARLIRHNPATFGGHKRLSAKIRGVGDLWAPYHANGSSSRDEGTGSRILGSTMPFSADIKRRRCRLYPGDLDAA